MGKASCPEAPSSQTVFSVSLCMMAHFCCPHPLDFKLLGVSVRVFSERLNREPPWIWVLPSIAWEGEGESDLKRAQLCCGQAFPTVMVSWHPRTVSPNTLPSSSCSYPVFGHSSRESARPALSKSVPEIQSSVHLEDTRVSSVSCICCPNAFPPQWQQHRCHSEPALTPPAGLHKATHYC